MAETYKIENVTPEKLDAGLARLRSSGFEAGNGRVKAMGVEASYALNGTTLEVTVEKAPPFVGGMIEGQLQKFFG